ncbi:hypothetical protein BROC_02005 [Candidatus Brocadiaceae bacterium]|nr:hypothetical protein BROC_02005 [Candidatus Brocadiaceae bacterium]
MGKVIFSIQYEIRPEKREEFLQAGKELKSLICAEGLESYSIYEIKGKTNLFEEVYIFTSAEFYENFDDAENERVNVLLSKMEDIKVQNTTKYNTLFELI